MFYCRVVTRSTLSTCNFSAKNQTFLSAWFIHLRKKLLDFVQLIVLSFRVLKYKIEMGLCVCMYVCMSESVFVLVRGNFKTVFFAYFVELCWAICQHAASIQSINRVILTSLTVGLHCLLKSLWLVIGYFQHFSNKFKT